MLKGENIHGYHILEDFKVAGGMSKISFADKEGKIYNLSRNFLHQNIQHLIAQEVIVLKSKSVVHVTLLRNIIVI